MAGVTAAERERLASVRADIARNHLRARGGRPPSSARGVHHVALICADVQRTVDFYQGVLEFPLTEMFENRDYEGSTHFFFDIGNGNLLAFFDFPGLGVGPYAEVLGGLHHIAISVTPERWEHLRAKLDAAGVDTDAGGYIPINHNCVTNVPHIYAAGDVSGKLPLSSVASMQGRKVAERLMGLHAGPHRHLDYDKAASAIFSPAGRRPGPWARNGTMCGCAASAAR